MKWLAWREKEVLVPCTMSAACSCHAGSHAGGFLPLVKMGKTCSLTPLFLPMDDKMKGARLRNLPLLAALERRFDYSGRKEECAEEKERMH
ncbi:hypothetical protein IEQ34_023844 [Dendrobium chrysotoxum]|uniref:Uncharacterized protein n=1 Tax=Dendrobium chrysotoxum TaxID=161865 RepID=A0AAV7FU22_DENCH|nr:hypothetical protein IEQ34_023844 [Dendrobium chrysotoxum]